jgi:hypothetical protein
MYSKHPLLTLRVPWNWFFQRYIQCFDMLEAHMTFAACILSSCFNDLREHTLEKFLKWCKCVDVMLSSWAHMLDVFFVISNNDTLCQKIWYNQMWICCICYYSLLHGCVQNVTPFFSSFTHHEKILHTHKKFCTRGFFCCGHRISQIVAPKGLRW